MLLSNVVFISDGASFDKYQWGAKKVVAHASLGHLGPFCQIQIEGTESKFNVLKNLIAT